MKIRRRFTAHPCSRIVVACSVLAAFASTVSTVAAQASNANPGVLPPDSHAFGNTYGGWSAAWWRYVLSQPVASNPLFDATGAGCRAGQSGKVFFLVGAFGSGSVTRDECTVPAGKALFFPLLDAANIEPAKTPLGAWEELEGAFGPFSEFHASVDGVAVANLDPASTPYRACAGPVAGCSAPSFSVTLPAENLDGIPEGTYEPTVADGFYLLLAPLRPGAHTISFGGTGQFAGGPLTQEITYHLVVVSGS